MDAPQSGEEVARVVDALRRIDPLLDVRWNPQAIKTKAASFDAFGCARKDAEYDGRWEVIRYNTPGLSDRGWVRITMVCAVEYTTSSKGGRYPIMLHQGPYAPLGPWLVDYMALWDRANSAWIDAMAAARDDHDRAESWMRDDEKAGHQEVFERFYREEGGVTLVGGAQGKTENAPWLGTAKRTSSIEVVSR
jgi:hypothetical protein